MSMLARLRNGWRAGVQAAFGASQPLSEPDHWLIRATGGGRTKSSVPVSEWTAVNLPVVWACVTLISDGVAQMPVDVLRRVRDRDGRVVRQSEPGHPVAGLLNSSANDDMGASVLVGATQLHALLWGNGYQEIERNGRGEPVGLWPLLPAVTWPRVDFTAGGRRLRYDTVIEGRSITIPADRVLHIRGQTYDGICGLSPVRIAREAIGMGLAMEEFGAKFFANDAKSGGFLMHPGKLGDKAIQNITESMGPGGQGGLAHAHEIKVLEEGMKFISTSIPPDDAQFLGSREFQISEIARIYRVPLVLLQVLTGSTVWGTGIEQLMIGFAVHTLGPWLRRWEEELGRKLLTESERRAGFYIKFNVNALLRGDMAGRSEFYTKLFQVGALNPNEIRAFEDLNPYDGGDAFRVPLNMDDPRSTGAAGAGEEERDAA